MWRNSVKFACTYWIMPEMHWVIDITPSSSDARKRHRCNCNLLYFGRRHQGHKTCKNFTLIRRVIVTVTTKQLLLIQLSNFAGIFFCLSNQFCGCTNQIFGQCRIQTITITSLEMGLFQNGAERLGKRKQKSVFGLRMYQCI